MVRIRRCSRVETELVVGAVITLFLLITVVAVPFKFREGPQTLWSRALGLVPFPVTQSNAATKPGEFWTLTYTGTTPAITEIDTTLQVTTKNCKLYNSSSCTSEIVTTPWLWLTGHPTEIPGQPRNMVNGVLVNWTPTTIPDGIYYAKFRPYNSTLTGTFDWSSYLIRTSSKFAKAGVTDTQIKQAIGALVDAQIAYRPVLTTVGYPATAGGVMMDTLGEVENNTALNAEVKFDFKQRVICGDSWQARFPYDPNWGDTKVKEWQDDFAELRRCYAVASTFLRQLDLWEYIKDDSPPVGGDLIALKERVTRSVYYSLLSFDILLAKPCTDCERSPTIANLKWYVENYANFTLGDTDQAKRYVTDIAPVLKTVGFAKKLGLVNDTYCSYTESPTSGQCVNVNIPQRVRDVTKKLYDTKVNEGWITTPPSNPTDLQHLWQRVGTALAVRINGDFTAISTTKRNELNTIAAQGFAAFMIPASDRTVSLLGDISSDKYQNLNNLFVISDWSPVTTPAVLQPIEDKAHVITANFREVYWANDKDPIFDTTTGKDSYNSFVGDNIKDCGVGGKMFNRAPGGYIVGLRGEPPSDALLTSLPAVRHIASGMNSYLLPEVNGLILTMAAVAQADPLDAMHERCTGTTWHGENDLISNLRHIGYMLVAYESYDKMQVQAF